MNIKILSIIFFQASSAILDLRNALSKELNIPQTLILIVDQENGTIFQDDIEIETLKQSPIEFILGNRNRTSIIEDDGSVENNVISNKNITYGKCKMSCGHFTGTLMLLILSVEAFIRSNTKSRYTPMYNYSLFLLLKQLSGYLPHPPTPPSKKNISNITMCMGLDIWKVWFHFSFIISITFW